MRSGLVLVDTNVVSYLFRGDSRQLEYQRILEPFERYAISIQTLAELQFWALKGNWGHRRRADLVYFLELYEVVYPDQHVCSFWAEVRSMRERKGLPIHPDDAWIAATALYIGCPVVTHNARDFTGIDGLKLLTSSPAE